MKTLVKNLILSVMISCLFVVSFQNTANAQNNMEIRNLTYKAYLMLSKNLAMEAVNRAEAIYKQSPDNMDALYDLTVAQYTLLCVCVAKQDEATFDDYADTTEENAEILEENYSNKAEAKALISGVLSYKIAMSPWKAMVLGIKSGSYLEEAFELNENQPFAMKLLASSKYHTPESVGGDINEAIKYYEKSLELYEKDSKLIINNWLYIDAMAWLGMAYQKVDDTENAIRVYNNALELEPNFNWVKKQLLPSAKKANPKS